LVTKLSGSSLVPGSLPYEVGHAASGDTIQFAANLNLQEREDKKHPQETLS
jgi:hypothetical protein